MSAYVYKCVAVAQTVISAMHTLSILHIIQKSQAEELNSGSPLSLAAVLEQTVLPSPPPTILQVRG